MINFKRDEEWGAIFTEEQYWILRNGEREQIFSGAFLHHQEKDLYFCIGCDSPIFHSAVLNLNNGWLNFRDTYGILSVTEWYPLRYGDPKCSTTPGKTICHGCDAHLGLVLKGSTAIYPYFALMS